MSVKEKKRTSVLLTVTVQVSHYDIYCLLVSAFESEIRYWCDLDRTKKIGDLSKLKKHPHNDSGYKNWYLTKPAGFHDDSNPDAPDYSILPLIPEYGLQIYEHKGEATTRKPLLLNLKTIQRGLEVMAKKYPHHFNNLSENQDGITADVFVQCCVFGDTVYG